MGEVAATQLVVYGDLPQSKRKTLETCAAAIDSARAKGVSLIFEIGKHLQVAHDALANHGDGTFGKWCKERCGISDRTARNYMGVVEVFGKQKQLVSERLSQTFTAESLYYLSRDTTPDAAIKDALKAAKSGERITLDRAKDFADKYTIASGSSVTTDYPDITQLMSKAEARIRTVFHDWPEEYCSEIPTVLSMLLKEDHSAWRP